MGTARVGRWIRGVGGGLSSRGARPCAPWGSPPSYGRSCRTVRSAASSAGSGAGPKAARRATARMSIVRAPEPSSTGPGGASRAVGLRSVLRMALRRSGARQRPHLAFRPAVPLSCPAQLASDGLRYGGSHGITRWRKHGWVASPRPPTPGSGDRPSGPATGRLSAGVQPRRAAIRSPEGACGRSGPHEHGQLGEVTALDRGAEQIVRRRALSPSAPGRAPRSAARTSGSGRRRRACWW